MNVGNAPDIARVSLDVGLTMREAQVAALLVHGLTYKRIARELQRHDGRSIVDHTVRVHVVHIAGKLGVIENVKAGVMAEISRRRLDLAAHQTCDRLVSVSS